MKTEKIKKLIELRNQYSNCKECSLHKTRNKIVFGRGAFNKRILIVGEAPGPDEDLAGDPFIGRAGKTLIKEGFKYIGFKRNDAFIMNSVLCYPGRNKEGGFNKPDEAHILLCRRRFNQTIRILNPIVILAMGNSALFALCNKQGIMENKDKALFYMIGDNKIPIIITYHPSAINRDKSRLVYFRQGWQAIKEAYDVIKAF